jgi:hypothetical protein
MIVVLDLTIGKPLISSNEARPRPRLERLSTHSVPGGTTISQRRLDPKHRRVSIWV